jgi:hypothetical protein
MLAKPIIMNTTRTLHELMPHIYAATNDLLHEILRSELDYVSQMCIFVMRRDSRLSKSPICINSAFAAVVYHKLYLALTAKIDEAFFHVDYMCKTLCHSKSLMEESAEMAARSKSATERSKLHQDNTDGIYAVNASSVASSSNTVPSVSVKNTLRASQTVMTAKDDDLVHISTSLTRGLGSTITNMYDGPIGQNTVPGLVVQNIARTSAPMGDVLLTRKDIQESIKAHYDAFIDKYCNMTKDILKNVISSMLSGVDLSPKVANIVDGAMLNDTYMAQDVPLCGYGVGLNITPVSGHSRSLVPCTSEQLENLMCRWMNDVSCAKMYKECEESMQKVLDVFEH